MIDINKLKLTDMGNPELIPQIVEEMNTKFIKEEEKIICEKLFDLDIDKDILINQTQEINRLNDILREYKELEEQGLLLKLPYKVGDTVWVIVNKGDYRQHVCEFEVTEISIKKINSYKKPRVHIGFIAGSIRRSLDTIGKTVFLTKEEAEQELKRLESAE